MEDNAIRSTAAVPVVVMDRVGGQRRLCNVRKRDLRNVVGFDGQKDVFYAVLPQPSRPL